MLRLREHHLHLPFFDVEYGKNVRLLYSIRIARDLVNKIALFFFPIFLFQVGSRTPELFPFALSTFQNGMLLIAGYFFIAQLTVCCSALLIGKMLPKIRHENSLLISSMLRAVVFTLLLFHSQSIWLIVLAAIIDGIQTNFFWVTYHTLISRMTHFLKTGTELGLLQFLLQLISVIAPAVAGLIIEIAGIEIIFLIAGSIQLLAGILAFSLRLKTERDTVSWTEFCAWLSERDYRRLGISFMGRYLNDASLFVWPLYVFFLLGAVDRVGYIYSLSLFLAMIVTLFIGPMLDSSKQQRSLFTSGGILSVLWLIRTQILGIWSIAVVDMIDRLTGAVHWLRFDIQFVRRGKGSQVLSYVVYHEILIGAIGALFWLVFGAVFLFSAGWTTIFILAAAGVLVSSMIRERHKESI